MKQLHGGNIYAYEAAHGVRPIDFSANINPLGMPEAAAAAAVDAMADAVHYPDPDCMELREAVAVQEGVSPAWVLCGNGASDLIYRFALGLRPQAALVCAPTFGEYARALEATGCTVRVHPLAVAEGFAVTDAILPALDGVQALCLCNPNNPTGRTIAPKLLSKILRACVERGIAVLLDECFVNFLDNPARHTRVPRLAEFPGLVILKSVTKMYAMPGLRLGYALSAEEGLLARMARVGAPWSVSSIAQAAGVAALADQGYVAEAQALIQSERAFMKQLLAQMELDAMGEANYLLVRGRPGLAQALAGEGVLVRDCASFGLSPEWMRVTVRTRAENMQLLSRISRCLHG